MKKLVALFLVLLQWPSLGLANAACETLTPEFKANHFLSPLENGICVVGQSGEAQLDMTHLMRLHDEKYGEVALYKSDAGHFLVIDDMFASLLESSKQDEVVPFIVSIVAIDLGILSAWMLTEMYSE